MEIWLVILFLSRQKFHAKHIFVLSSFMKLGPGVSCSIVSILDPGFLTRQLAVIPIIEQGTYHGGLNFKELVKALMNCDACVSLFHVLIVLCVNYCRFCPSGLFSELLNVQSTGTMLV